ncbi:uncharacterized protein [Palaemon carinicauda]|uniref:uncharacterized protein n=1 Tax=Palaemon carinicauda TaxID=392227 RepID=UPI0035B63C36
MSAVAVHIILSRFVMRFQPAAVHQSEILCKLDYGDFITQELTKTSQPLLSELGRKLDLVPVDLEKPYLGMEACVERLLKTSNIHLDFFPFLESSLSQMGLSKKVYFVQEVIYKNNLVLFFKKHNAWKYKFDQAILQFLDTGLILKWKQDIMNELRKTSKVGKDEETDQLMAISINHLQGPFFILAFSIIFSIFTFCFEKIFL